MSFLEDFKRMKQNSAAPSTYSTKYILRSYFINVLMVWLLLTILLPKAIEED